MSACAFTDFLPTVVHGFVPLPGCRYHQQVTLIATVPHCQSFAGEVWLLQVVVGSACFRLRRQKVFGLTSPASFKSFGVRTVSSLAAVSPF